LLGKPSTFFLEPQRILGLGIEPCRPGVPADMRGYDLGVAAADFHSTRKRRPNLTAAAGLLLEGLAVKAPEEWARLSYVRQQRQSRYDSRLQCHPALMSVLRVAQHHPAAIEAYVVASIDREGFA